ARQSSPRNGPSFRASGRCYVNSAERYSRSAVLALRGGLAALVGKSFGARMKHNERTWLIAGVAAALSACSGGGGDGGSNAGASTGTLSISLMDAPVDGVTNVFVEIEAISMKPTDGPPVELTLASAPVTVDLLELTDENAAVLIDGAVVPA